MNGILAGSLLSVGLIMSCFLAQGQLSIKTENTITRYRQASSKRVIAVFGTGATAKDSWQVSRQDIDYTNRSFTNATVLIDKLAAVYDTWYDTATEQVTAIADLPQDDTAQAYSYIMGTAPANFSRKVVSLFYPYFDPLGFTACQYLNGDLGYVHYDSIDIDFTTALVLKDLKVDQLSAMNARGFAVEHNAGGYFLMHVPSKALLSAGYSTKLKAFQPNVFLATYPGTSTLIVINGFSTDSSIRYSQMDTVAGHWPCLDLHNVGTQHILQLDSARSFLLPDFGNDANDRLMGYPFQDSILVKIRRDDTDTFYCFDIRNKVLTPVTHLDTSDHIDIFPFDNRYFLTKDAEGMLRVSDLSGQRQALNGQPFKALYRLYYPGDANRYFLCLTGTETSLYIFRITIRTDGTFSARLIASTISATKIRNAFQHNTLLVKDDAGWRFIDGITACNTSSSIKWDDLDEAWPWCYYRGKVIKDIFFQSRSPLPGLQTMLIRYQDKSEKDPQFTLLRIDHPPLRSGTKKNSHLPKIKK